MKKILPCGLFALLSSGFMEVNASSIPQPGTPVSPPRVMAQPLSQVTSISPKVDHILQNLDTITAIWCCYCSTKQLMPDQLQILKSSFSAIQALTQEQVLELQTRLKQEAAKRKGNTSMYVAHAGSVSMCGMYEAKRWAISIPFNKIGNELEILSGLTECIALLSKLGNASEILLTKDCLDRDSIDVLYSFARAIKGRSYERTFNRLWPLLPFVLPENRQLDREAAPLAQVIKTICGLCCSDSKPRIFAWDAKISGDQTGGVAIEPVQDPRLRQVGQSGSLFEPCEVRFVGKGNWDIGSSYMIPLVGVLSRMGVLLGINIVSTYDTFRFPCTQNIRVKNILLKQAAMSDQLVEFLCSLSAVERLNIDNIRGDTSKLIKFLDRADCRINTITYVIGDEDPTLLQYLLNSKRNITFESIHVNPNFLHKYKDSIDGIREAINKRPTPLPQVGLLLDEVDNDDFAGIFHSWNSISASPLIKSKLLSVPYEMLSQVYKIKEFKYQLQQSCIDKFVGFAQKEKSLTSLIGIISSLPVHLRKITFGFANEQQAREQAKIAVNKILEYCNNIEDLVLRCAPQVVRFPSLVDSARIVLHPVFSRTVRINNRLFVQNELNKHKKDASFNWETVTSENELAKYPVLLEELIINTKGFRAVCASILIELWKMNHGNIGLKSVNRQIAKHVAFLADKAIPRLSKIINTIREGLYFQSPRQEETVEKCREFLTWIQYFESRLNIFTDSVIASIRILLSQEVNRSLIEQLKLLEENASIQREWRFKLIRQVCLPLTFKLAEFSETNLQRTLGVSDVCIQEPDKKRRKE